LQYGNEQEPFIPHFHVWGRGDVNHEYVPGVPLQGQVPYEVMVPRQQHADWIHENDKYRVAWALAQQLQNTTLPDGVSILEQKFPK